MNDAKQTVLALLDALHRMDWEAYYGLMDDDIDYRMGTKIQLRGVAAVRHSMARLGGFTQANAEIIVMVGEGDTVMTERVDRMVIGGREAALPVAGTFVVRNGRVVAWRDYFDWQLWAEQLGLTD